MNEQNKQEAPPQNANQLWVDHVAYQLRVILEPPIKNADHSFHTSVSQLKLRSDKAVELMVAYSNTRLRVVVDEIIQHLELVRGEHKRIDEEFKATHWIRFKKKRELFVQACGLATQEHAFQTSLLVVLNTLPPQKKVEHAGLVDVKENPPVAVINEKEPQMEVTKRTQTV
jgi:hypothetical protein